MKKMLIIFFIINFMNIQSANEITQIIVVTGIEIAVPAVYFLQIAAARLIGDQDRVKRLDFCAWETQNTITALKKAKTKQEIEAVGIKFAEQMNFCEKLITLRK